MTDKQYFFLIFKACPFGWLFGQNANNCYFFSDVTNGTQLKTFAQAQQACAAMPVSNPDGGMTTPNLLTLTTQTEAVGIKQTINY